MKWPPPLPPRWPQGPFTYGAAFREGDVATTHFFLSKRVGNSTNARQISPESEKRKWANTKASRVPLLTMQQPPVALRHVCAQKYPERESVGLSQKLMYTTSSCVELSATVPNPTRPRHGHMHISVCCVSCLQFPGEEGCSALTVSVFPDSSPSLVICFILTGSL